MTKLIDLINDTVNTVTNSGIKIDSPVLQEAAAAVAKENKERLVLNVKGLIGNFDSYLTESVRNLKRLREQEKKQAELVKKIDRAYRYFAGSGNPLPVFDAIGQRRLGNDWCNRVGVEVPGQDDPLWSVPANFKK